ncbi:MAG TPA: hypothetical protein VFP37_15505 [Steroidobacteraceae bacterium]|nr:hypothetical protein [Steroidobacteraceae bacterium]
MARYDREWNARERERERWFDRERRRDEEHPRPGDYRREDYGRGPEPPQDDHYRYVSECERGEYYGGANYERDWGSQGRRHPDSYEQRRNRR